MTSQSDMAEGIMKAIGIKQELDQAKERIADLERQLRDRALPDNVPEIDRLTWFDPKAGNRTLIVGAIDNKVAAKVLDENGRTLVEMWATSPFK